MSGYGIKKLIDVGLAHFWQENYGQIYPTLDALVKDGLATKAEDASTGKRKKYLYSITPEGRRVLRAWIKAPTAMPAVRNELLLKLFFSKPLPQSERSRLLQEYQAQQQRMLAEYQHSEEVLRSAVQEGQFSEELDELLAITSNRRSRKARQTQCQAFLLTLRHGILMTEARLAWCQEAFTELGE